MGLVACEDANLIVERAKAIGILFRWAVEDRPKLAYPQRNAMLLGKLCSFGIEEAALLLSPIPQLGATCRSRPGMDLAGVLAGSEARHSVVMRAVDEVIVKGFVEAGELLCVVIAFEEDDVPGIYLADLSYKPPIEGVDAFIIGLVIGIDIPRVVAVTIVRTRLVEHVVASHYRPVLVAPRKLLPQGDEAILIVRNFPKETDARCVVRVPMDVLPALS